MWMALLCAVPVWAALASGAFGALYRPHGLLAWWAFVAWQPLVEEIVFRGLLQTELLRRPAWRLPPTDLPVSRANVLTALVFAVAHVPEQGPIWALAVVPPALLLGHLRERFGSVWPAWVAHAAYNLGFAVVATM